MKKLLPAAVAAALLTFGALAHAAPIQQVDDPSGQFSGTYDCSYYTYDASGNATKVNKTCSQTGYVAIYSDGVTACNGNASYTRPDTGAPLQGYIWVGPSHAASNASAASPGGEIGAGDNTKADDPSTQSTNESHGPCEN